MKTRLLLSLFALLIASSARAQPLPPEKSMAMFKVSDGLEITLWAAEPMLVNPSIMDVDHKGRVWVGDSVNYRQRLHGEKTLRRPEGDRILVLEDTKGGGKADKVTTFFQEKDFVCPLGIAVAPYPEGGQKIYVCHSPHIYVFEDKNDDLKPDGPPKILLTGFKGFDHDHGVHGIYIGPDNKLYFSVGDQGVSNLQSSDGKGRKWSSNSTDCRAGTIWRCDLDGKNLELLAHNFRNNYEPCMDSFGTLFISDNDDDGNDQVRICYVMPGGNYGYHPRGKGQTHWHEEQPGIVPKILRTYRGSPCGMAVYEGTLLPKKYWGQPLHVDAGPGRLSCYHLKPKGAGYEVEREDMVTSKDSYFRPSDVTVAPDGSLFVCDWYDQGVGGHAARNLEDGRIYRVAPKGNKPSLPAVDVKTPKGILTALYSPNLGVRAMAMAKLHSMKPRDALIALSEGIAGPSESFLAARTLWQIFPIRNAVAFADQPEALKTNLVATISQAQHKPWLAPLMVRILRDLGPRLPKKVLQEDMERIATAHIREASELLLALRHQDSTAVRPLLYELAKHYDGKDRFYLAAIGIAVGAPGISKEIDERRQIILADFDKHFPEWNEKVAGLIWELRPPGMVAMLQKYLANAKRTAAERGQIVDLLAGSSDPAAPQALLELLGKADAELRAHILVHFRENLPERWSFLKKGDALDELIQRALNGDAAARESGLALVEALGSPKWRQQASVFAADGKAPAAVRVAAIRALGSIKQAEAKATLTEILQDKKQPEPLRAEAIRALGREASWLTVPLLEVATDARGYSLELRQAAVAGLAGHKGTSEQLLQYYGEKKLDKDLTADLARLLRNSPFADVKKQAQKVLPAPPKMDPKNLPSIPALLARKANPERGKQVLLATLKNEAQCLKCHVVGGVGGQVGPDLTSIGAKASRENLLESILYPNRAISHQFESWVVDTKQGLTVIGLIIEDTPDHILVRDASAKDYKISKKDLDTKVQSKTSLMPDNLILYLPEEDLLDMVEYLYSLKSPGLAPTSWNFDRERNPLLAFSVRRMKPFASSTER